MKPTQLSPQSIGLAFCKFKPFWVKIVAVETAVAIEEVVFLLVDGFDPSFRSFHGRRNGVNIQLRQLFGSIAGGTQQLWSIKVLARNNFLDLQIKRALREWVEDKFKTLALVVNEIAQRRLLHQIEVVFLIAGIAHILARDLLATLPFAIANIKRGHLVVGIVAITEHGLVEVKERGVAVNFKFTEKPVDFF